MELRPRPFGREFPGYARVAVKKWIKDPGNRMVIPDHIAKLTSHQYQKAMKASEKHRAAVKDNPDRPEQLDSGFFEPEIFTIRRPNKSKAYLQRHPDMVEPTMNDENSPKRMKSSSPVPKSADNDQFKE